MTIIPQPTPVWLSEQATRELVISARRAKASLLAIISGIDSKVEARRATINNSLNDLDVKDRLRAVDASASTLKITLKNETNKERTELLRSLARMHETAAAAIGFWDNPVSIVLRETIASDKRATIYGNLASAGPVELKSFASLAIAAKDLELGAAVISRLHGISPASARPASPKVLADSLRGDLSRELHAALLEVDSLLTESVLANRNFEAGRSGNNAGIGSVEAALKRRRLEAVGGKAVEGDDSDE